jgi:hypothetical protein
MLKKRLFSYFQFVIMKIYRIIWALSQMSPSSRGLGHLVFIQATGVRIPLGMPSFFFMIRTENSLY